MTPTEFDDFYRELQLKLEQACSMRTVRRTYIHVTGSATKPCIILCNSKTVRMLTDLSVMKDILRGDPPQVDIVTA